MRRKSWFARFFILTMVIVIALFPLAGAVLAASPGMATVAFGITASPGWVVTSQTAPPPIYLTPEMLALIAGGVLSLAFSYIPGLNTWYAKFDDTTKRGYMAILLLIVAAGLFGLQCANILFIGIACTQAGAQSIVWIYILAIVGNQSTFSISPRTADVQKAKAERDLTATANPG